MRIAIYPGTFDPITYGHIDVLERAIELFDKVIIAVAINLSKQPLFSERERVDLIKSVTKRYGKRVEVATLHGLVVEYAKQRNAIAIVRGIRAIADFEYEFQMALMNRKLDSSISTVYLMPHEKFTYLNSSLIREVAKLGGKVDEFIPKEVNTALKKKFKVSRT